MEENKTEALQPVELPEAEAAAPQQFSQETLAALAQAVAAYMQPEQKPAAASPGEKTAEAAASAKQEPELTPEEKKAAEAAKKEELKQKRRKRRMRELRALLIKTVLLLAVIYVLFFKIVGVTVMPSGDMYPRIDSGDLVLYYRLDKDVRAQDIVVFTKDAAELQQTMDAREGNGGVSLQLRKGSSKSFLHSLAVTLGMALPDNLDLYICRVVAVGGDTVEISDSGRLIVNGNSMVETNIFSQTTAYLGFVEYPLTLRSDECFVMADQRNGGVDSRFFGAVRTDEILGTVITIARRNNL